MSQFSNALAAALRDLQWSQTELARRANMKLPYVNRYVRGKLTIGLANLETIARQLPEKQRAQVVAAWLRDALPNSATGLLAILTPGRAEEEAPLEPILTELNPQLRRSIEFLIEAARQHTEISDLLIDLEKALRAPED